MTYPQFNKASNVIFSPLNLLADYAKITTVKHIENVKLLEVKIWPYNPVIAKIAHWHIINSIFHTQCLFLLSYWIISSLVTFWNVGSVDDNRNLSRKHLLGRWAMICDFHQSGWRAKNEHSTILSQRFLKSLRRLIDQFRNLTYIRKVQLEFRIFQNDLGLFVYRKSRRNSTYRSYSQYRIKNFPSTL